MADLSLPPLELLPKEGAAMVWPTPDLPGYPPPTPLLDPLPCAVEGGNGHALKGQLFLFQPAQGQIQVLMPGQRKPMPLKPGQFRRLCLTEPLEPEKGDPARAALLHSTLNLPFTVRFHGGDTWNGTTAGWSRQPFGLFLFEPVDEHGAVRRWFVPVEAYEDAEVGLRLGEALVEQNSASPAQIEAALAEQERLRARKLGDILVVRQIITPDELGEAIEQQSKMPMVRIGEALLALGYINEGQLDEALRQQREDRNVPLGELLVRNGTVTRADLQTALARKMGYPLVDVDQFPSDTEALSRLPYTVAARVPALPLMMRGGRLVVAVEDPSNRRQMDEVEFAAQCKVLPVLVRAGVLDHAIERAYEKLGAGTRPLDELGRGTEIAAGDASKLLASMESVGAQLDDDDLPPIEQSDNSLVRLINTMILEAQAQGVSDIHVECPAGREKVRIRFRKDGLMRQYLELPHTYRQAVIGRLKVMCDLDISERRKPQDGKINFGKFVPGVRLELRVATIPTANNLEDAVLRLLLTSKPIALAELGLSPDNLTRLSAAAERPNGMLLCVGPTGSGKTTTLHSVLGHINTPDRKIWTAEDPVEITQPGLRQVQVNPRIDWTFAKALRAFLRADPDVIMVGEIRDQETAQVAIEASLTGHLLLSTLHTNSAPETVTRLLDMGMDPFNFADALLGVLAQRLVRRTCSACHQPHTPTAAEIDELLTDWLQVMAPLQHKPRADEVLAGWQQRFAPEGSFKLYRPVGCPQCNGTGYRGRAAIHELMMISRNLRRLIQTGTRSDDLQRAALAEGMRTLRQDGIEKVLAGVTTIEEVRANS